MSSIRNVLLASLPRKVYQEVQSGFSEVTLEFGEMLYEHDQPMLQVYFPVTCLVSLMVVVDQDMALEVAVVGREGMVGVALALGARFSPVRAIVQGEGLALRMNRARFLASLRSHLPLQRALDSYTHGLMAQIAQTAACNRFHLLNARLARWLLMTRDRLASGEFRVTQQFLAAMLGVRRVGVSEAASSFQQQNLIRYSRGVITILDHAGLEAACCSCYGLDAVRAGAMANWRPAAGAMEDSSSLKKSS